MILGFSKKKRPSVDPNEIVEVLRNEGISVNIDDANALIDHEEIELEDGSLVSFGSSRTSR